MPSKYQCQFNGSSGIKRFLRIRPAIISRYSAGNPIHLLTLSKHCLFDEDKSQIRCRPGTGIINWETWYIDGRSCSSRVVVSRGGLINSANSALLLSGALAMSGNQITWHIGHSLDKMRPFCCDIFSGTQHLLWWVSHPLCSAFCLI